MLMAGHYLTAMVVALLCAALYHKIGIDLGSFQFVPLDWILPAWIFRLTNNLLRPAGTDLASSSSSWRSSLSPRSPRSVSSPTSGCCSCGSGAFEPDCRSLSLSTDRRRPPFSSANGYYSPIAYFLSKVLFDIIPLRLVPSVILGCIVYGLVGLVPNLVEFWKFLLILVLFNLAAASVVLFLSVAVANNGLASLAGSLVMLYK